MEIIDPDEVLVGIITAKKDKSLKPWEIKLVFASNRIEIVDSREKSFKERQFRLDFDVMGSA